MTTPTRAELDRCLVVAGGIVGANRDTRIDRPLDEQVAQLIRFAASPEPPRLTRSVPVRWDDYDELITGVIGKLLEVVKLALEQGLELNDADRAGGRRLGEQLGA